jgi:predicted enzyme related to lactoylglutathione lyase
MSIRTSPWPAGFPCWADLTAPDTDVAKSFYNVVLGWTFDDQGEEFGDYSIATVKGVPAAGLGPAQEGQPNAWTLYLASDDADATAAAVREHGGTTFAEPFDVGPLGRMLVAGDPTGAAFGVWEAREHIGANVVNEPGALTWEDLRTSDPAAARAFYSAVFGYRLEPLVDAGPDYALFHLGDDPAPLGGMGGMFGAPAGTPPHWIAYFAVDDAVSATETAEINGGIVLAPPFATPYGVMAGLTDPAGAVFWISQVDRSQQPDRSG